MFYSHNSAATHLVCSREIPVPAGVSYSNSYFISEMFDCFKNSSSAIKNDVVARFELTYCKHFQNAYIYIYNYRYMSAKYVYICMFIYTTNLIKCIPINGPLKIFHWHNITTKLRDNFHKVSCQGHGMLHVIAQNHPLATAQCPLHAINFAIAEGYWQFRQVTYWSASTFGSCTHCKLPWAHSKL